MAKLRLAFMGTPDFAAVILHHLIAAGHDLAAVYCQPPRAKGRGHQVTPSAVQALATHHNLLIRHPSRLGPPEASEFASLGLDAAVVAAYGLILPPAILAAPRRGCLNVHASLLPRWRGAAPIERAILAGDAETGVTIMQMDEGLDTGTIAAVEKVPIGPATTAGALRAELAALGARLIVATLASPEPWPRRPQPLAGITYAKKIARDEGRIDWRKSAPELERQVRALDCWFEAKGERVKLVTAVATEGRGAPGAVLDAAPTVACGAGALRLLRVQRAGRAMLDGAALLRGFALPLGTVLPCPVTS